MSERKVLNKYFPPNFDPSKIPKRKAPVTKQHTVRLMAPFSMRCNTCGEYIYKGRKFNARKETVEGESYLGIKIYRFYIRCPLCAAEITYKTDPQNADYASDAGATRNFEPWREERAKEEREKERRRIEELYDPVKALESKTYDSKRELDIIEALDEIRTQNARLERVDADQVFERVANNSAVFKGDLEKEEDLEDEQVIRDTFNRVHQEQLAIPSHTTAQGSTSTTAKTTTTTKDLLLTSSITTNSTNALNGIDNKNNKRKLTAASLGIIPKRKPESINKKT